MSIPEGPPDLPGPGSAGAPGMGVGPADDDLGSASVPATTVATLLPDVARLLRDLVADPRVPWHAKAIAAAATVYVAPLTRQLLPRRLPLGPVGDVAVVIVAVRRLIAAAGYEVVRETWRGDDASFVWLLILTGIDA